MVRPLVPREHRLTTEFRRAHAGGRPLYNWQRPTRRNWENRSLARIKAKITLPKLKGGE